MYFSVFLLEFLSEFLFEFLFKYIYELLYVLLCEFISKFLCEVLSEFFWAGRNLQEELQAGKNRQVFGGLFYLAGTGSFFRQDYFFGRKMDRPHANPILWGKKKDYRKKVVFRSKYKLSVKVSHSRRTGNGFLIVRMSGVKFINQIVAQLSSHVIQLSFNYRSWCLKTLYVTRQFSIRNIFRRFFSGYYRFLPKFYNISIRIKFVYTNLYTHTHTHTHKHKTTAAATAAWGT